MMDDDDAVARQPNVKLQSVGALGETAIKRRDGIFRRQRATAAMSKYQWPRAREECASSPLRIKSAHGGPNSDARRAPTTRDAASAGQAGESGQPGPEA